jgi:hypothetical protein
MLPLSPRWRFGRSPDPRFRLRLKAKVLEDGSSKSAAEPSDRHLGCLSTRVAAFAPGKLYFPPNSAAWETIR